MAKGKLQEFFHEKKAKAGTADIDWQGKRDAWIVAIEKLYEVITTQYLASSIADGTVAVSYEGKEIVEDYIGEYTVRMLVLRVGDEKVVFCPKGTNIVGASGRIDLMGDMGTVTIIREPPDRWGVVVTRTPTLKVTPLSEESLLTALKSVMRR
jgi:hypothetical protein